MSVFRDALKMTNSRTTGVSFACLGQRGFGDIVGGWSICEACDGEGYVSTHLDKRGWAWLEKLILSKIAVADDTELAQISAEIDDLIRNEEYTDIGLESLTRLQEKIENQMRRRRV